MDLATFFRTQGNFFPGASEQSLLNEKLVAHFYARFIDCGGTLP
jgi:hypothetical protein